LLSGGGDVALTGDVGFDEQRFVSCCLYGGGDLRTFLGINLREGDSRTFLGEFNGNRFTNTLSCARYECYFSV
jgi:hypothetical protein